MTTTKGFDSKCIQWDDDVSYWIGTPDGIVFHAWINDRHKRIHYLRKGVTEEEARQAIDDFLNKESI